MLSSIADTLYNIVWSPALIVLLVGAGLYFTIRTRCVQVRRVGLMARLLFSRKSSGGQGMSSFEAFCVALSGRVGTGNIVGVATAIALGGPGAVFWMWVIAFLGASTAFMESTLSQIYRRKHSDGWRGGPSDYIDRGLGQRWLGVVFAIFTILGYGLLLAMVQANGVSSAFANSFSVKPVWSGVGLAVVLMLVVVGGIKRIARVASVVTPFMAAAYVLMALVIIVINWRAVPGVFASIFRCAFGADQAFGGIVGSAIAMGVKRGLFSNEAGQGGGAYVSASADVPSPAQQGLVQAFSVYIDTILVCTATALMILCTGCFNVFGPDGSILASGAAALHPGSLAAASSAAGALGAAASDALSTAGAAVGAAASSAAGAVDVSALGSNYVGYTQAAIDTVFHGVGSSFVAIALCFFAFTTLMAYYFYSESSIIYICGLRGGRGERLFIWVYRILLVAVLIFGACNQADAVWTIGDVGLGLTTWVNVLVLLILCPQALRALKDFESSLKS